MPAATLTIPVTVKTPAHAALVKDFVVAAAGASDVVVDATAGKATLRYEFPGDIDPLMRRLYERGLANSATLAVLVSVRANAGSAANPSNLIATLNNSASVTNASYDGKTVAATIAAAGEAMRYLYDEIVAAGLTPI
jgi:hypothetical protein